MEWMKTLLPDAYIVDPFKAVPVCPIVFPLSVLIIILLAN